METAVATPAPYRPYVRLSFADIVNHKKLTDEELDYDIQKLKDYDATENKRTFCGNPFLYHYQLENMCKVKVGKKPSLYDVMNNDKLYQKVWDLMITNKRGGKSVESDFFEANRYNGAVVCFKSATAKYIYKKYNAKSVLDPTAGWGGRMLGAHALGIKYTGIDLNDNMANAYQEMMNKLQDENLTMIFGNSLDIDFSEIEYDFVLTSPPYVNLELYENMTPYDSNKSFYDMFLIPLLKKCLKHIKPYGKVCFNISPKMYKDLIKFGFRECDYSENLLQQKRDGKDKQDQIYIWHK